MRGEFEGSEHAFDDRVARYDPIPQLLAAVERIADRVLLADDYQLAALFVTPDERRRPT